MLRSRRLGVLRRGLPKVSARAMFWPVLSAFPAQASLGRGWICMNQITLIFFVSIFHDKTQFIYILVFKELRNKNFWAGFLLTVSCLNYVSRGRPDLLK